MIQLREISRIYNKVKALDRVSLEIPTTGSLAVLGPSGSGKTTLLRLIAGLEAPDEGEVYLDGSLASSPAWTLAPHKRGMGFVFQAAALWPHMTVAQNILFGLRGWPKAKKLNRLRELLDQTGLRDLADRYPDQISGGEARRAALARSLANYPRYLLMDEPLTNLDEELKFRLLAYIKETVKQNQTCLVYVTHDPAEAEQICDRVLVIERGSLPKAP